MIEILRTGYGESAPEIAENAQRLVDSVYIKHKDILLWCDTAYIYSGTNRVDAIGNVHINQGDTVHLYANNIFYDGDNNFARAWDKVALINNETKLYTDTLDYDLENNIGYYDDFGKIIDSTTTLTSIVGKYYIDDKNIFFYKKVNAFNDDFTLESDTVKYNTETKIMFVEGPTTIRDSANTLYCENGWYNSITGDAELKINAEVFNDTQNLKAKYIKYNKQQGAGTALGSVRIEDFENRSIILGEKAIYNKQEETALVTDSAVYITYSDTDTLFLSADTLHSTPDTIENEKIITAYFNVSYYRTDMQGLCDSLVYFTNDSIIQLYIDPIVWSENHQITADKIEMQQNNNAPDELHLSGNAFIISEQDTGKYDQIKGREMVGYIVNQKLNKIDVNGNGQTLYYARQDEEIIGVNRAESSKISIRFKDEKIYKIYFFTTPEGELKPLLDLTDSDKKLSGFHWKIKQRPLSKYDILPRSKRTEYIDNSIVKPRPLKNMEMLQK